MNTDFGSLAGFAPLLVQATAMTIFLAVTSQMIGTITGLLLALARMSNRAWLWFPAFVYIWIARGTPALVHLFFIYFGLPAIGIRFDPLPAAIIAFSISSSAYNAEILRAGLASVAVGQIEAAKALGMTYRAIVRSIVLPQAVRVVAGPYISTFISHVKGTSLASVVTIRELMMVTQMIYTITFRAMEALLLTGSIYLMLTTVLSVAQVWLERRLAFEKRPLSARRRARLGLDQPLFDAPAAVASRPSPAAGEVIRIEGISKSFGGVKAIDDVSLVVHRGEVVCLLGPSGSGKSTLLRSINLLERPDMGRLVIACGGAPFHLDFGSRAMTSAKDLIRLRSAVGMVFQNFNLWPHKVALENVIEGLIRVRRMQPQDAARTGRRMLARVGLAAKLAAFPEHLSGGQRQRVGIARALAMEPEIMLFDEPTSSLDPELVGEVLDVIEAVAASGMTTVIATHEMGFARRIADRIVFMDRGSIVEVATAEAFFNQPEHERSQRFLKAVLR